MSTILYAIVNIEIKKYISYMQLYEMNWWIDELIFTCDNTNFTFNTKD
jgi:hypothetical protein